GSLQTGPRRARRRTRRRPARSPDTPLRALRASATVPRGALSRRHGDAAAAWVAGAFDLAVAPQHRLHAAEEEVARGEAHDLELGVEAVELDVRLAEQHAVLEVAPRRADRGGGREAVVDHADDRLQQRRADAVRAGAAEHE